MYPREGLWQMSRKTAFNCQQMRGVSYSTFTPRRMYYFDKPSDIHSRLSVALGTRTSSELHVVFGERRLMVSRTKCIQSSPAFRCLVDDNLFQLLRCTAQYTRICNLISPAAFLESSIARRQHDNGRTPCVSTGMGKRWDDATIIVNRIP